MAICEMIGGAQDWVSITEFGRVKERWFRRFLEFPHGIPFHVAFGRAFSPIFALSCTHLSNFKTASKLHVANVTSHFLQVISTQVL
jgi:hypothetical protein